MHNDRHSSRSMFSISGWLFADMFLALMMIFIIASTVGKESPPTNTVTPTPTQAPHLELNFHHIEITVQTGQTAEEAVKAEIQSQTPETAFLQGRRVGLVVIFTGAPTTGDIPTAQDTDENVKRALQSLNINDFANASYYDSTDNNRMTDLTLLGYSSSFIVIDIYIFSQ